jgi:hypothetical protein
VNRLAVKQGCLALVLAFALASCSQNGDGAATTGRLRGDEPAPEQGGEPAFGHRVAIGAVRLVISDPRPGPGVPSLAPDEAGVLAVTARSENPTGRRQENPQVAVYCAGDVHGGWFTVSQWEPGQKLEPTSFSEGELVLGLPIDCQSPVIRATNYTGRETDIVTWPLPPDVVQAVVGSS